MLCDPISADPVILVKKRSLDSLTVDAQPETLPGFRLIPSDRGLISAFRPQKICVKGENGKEREASALIGIDTAEGTFSGSDALVPASIIL